MKLKLFKANRTAYCTCPPKYSLNTYLGRCQHECIYCYQVKFPSFTGEPRPRLKLLEKIDEMAKNTKLKLPVMISDCTDPYQPMEREYKITRKCLETLVKYGFPILIATKSDLVLRDVDILKKANCVASITVTTLNTEYASVLEPGAPNPWLRINALKKISKLGIPTIARIDPVIPYLTDKREELEYLISVLAEAGVKQITTSTLKPVNGFFAKVKEKSPELYHKLRNLYNHGEKISGYKYLPKEARMRIILMVRDIALKYGLEFASCREGLPEYNTVICDGTTYCTKTLKLTKYMELNKL